MTDRIRIATPEDGPEILRILEASAAEGGIELLYTRRPDAYASYEKEPGEARVFVSTDGDRTVGVAAELIREVYLGGQAVKAAYICGLKKDPAYEGTAFGLRFIHALRQEGTSLYYCSVLSDNTAAQGMFERGRRALKVSPICAYTTHILNPAARKVRRKLTRGGDPALRPATQADRPALTAFLAEEGSRHDLFPVMGDLSGFHGLSAEDFLLYEEAGEIRGAVALWDQTDYRQYVVKRYRGIMRAARRLNPLLEAAGYIRLPREEEPLCFPMLSFLLARGDEDSVYRALLAGAVTAAAARYGMCVIGLPKSHPAAPLLGSLPAIRFDTKLYAVTLPPVDESSPIPDPATVFPECGML